MLRAHLRSGRVRTSRSGNALAVGLLLLILVTAGVGALLTVSVSASDGVSARVDRFEVKRAATSSNRLAAQEIWSGYMRTLGGAPTTLIDVRNHLNGIGLLAQDPAAPTRTEYVDTLGFTPDGPSRFLLGDTEIESVLVHRVDDPRRTRLEVTTVAVARRGADDEDTDVVVTATDVFALEPPRWEGLDYTLLANNINCIMCHTTVDDTRRIYPGSPGFRGAPDFDRARVGSIESFQFRHDPDSFIAGTLYLGGPAVDEHGDPIANWGSLNLKSAEFDGSGRLLEDLFGDLTVVDMDPADAVAPAPYENLYLNYFDNPEPIDGVLPETFPLPFRDDGGYEVATGTATPEAGEGNRQVDPNEFDATVASFSGSIAGGRIGVAPGSERVTTIDRARELAAGTQTSLASVTDGNVILTGTDTDPIQIDGDVAIDGDLVISGPITGSGSLWVKGNIYVRGDLEYDDSVLAGVRQFGYSPSGQQNALGMTAGGNVLIGDIYRPEWGTGSPVTGVPDGTWNFTIEQAAIFNRREWIKTQPELPGERVEVAVGSETRQRQLMRTVEWEEEYAHYANRWNGEMRTVDIVERVQVGTREEPVYTWVTVPPLLPPPYGRERRVRRQTGTREVPVYENRVVGTREERVMERTFIEMRTRTRSARRPYDPPRYESYEVTVREWQTPTYPNPDYRGPDFVPRYYAFGDGDPVPVMNKNGHFDPTTGLWVAEERAAAWDEDEITIADPSDPNDPLLYPAGGPVAAITTLESTGSWIDADVLRGLITDSLGDRPEDESLKVDATLYSANSIFGIVPNSPGEGTNGELRVQGALLAADIGVLGPVGAELYYDPRGQEVLDIRDEALLTLVHVGRIPSVRY
ncbi:MAG: hypothetical protein AAGA20_12805 [Planctomycetota bacterium]